ncbi:hypothetical protein E3N88_18781 [Mikania micrantha]|uniref:Uncharacterized protein n=1 Tax=Mikania micrantha TaxID=192012 RepID=A0A5N6NNT0_9ASTR|nr:hypothetical protein E3N88_18781 [Mikania micrantha]
MEGLRELGTAEIRASGRGRDVAIRRAIHFAAPHSYQIGEIPTLERIKIHKCWCSVGESVRRIQEEQHDFGNYDLHIVISDELKE